MIPKKFRWLQRALSKPTENCIEWPFSRGVRGYAQTTWDGKNAYVHRVVTHLQFNFDMDSDSVVMHKCNNTSCINPKHLEIGTQRQNIEYASKLGRLSVRKTPRKTCWLGHEFTKENTFINSDGRRRCRTCRERLDKNRIR